MDALQQARKEIDRIDRDLIRLFEDRMNEVAVLAAYKEEHGLPVTDKQRESEKKEALSSEISTEFSPYVLRFLHDVMEISKQYQKDRRNRK